MATDALPPMREFLGTLEGWQLSVLLVVVSIVAARVVDLVSVYLMRLLTTYTTFDASADAFNRLHFPIYVSAFLIGLTVAIEPLALSRSLRSLFHSVFITLGVLVWIWGVLGLSSVFVHSVVDTRFDQKVIPIIDNILTAVVLIAAMVVILRVWDVSLTPLLASAGVLGVAVGFAAREAIANFFGSVALFADETYYTGQFIELDDGTMGTVTDVGIRSTTLETRDGDLVTIPNSMLNETKIKNKSAPQTKRRLRVPVGVAYDSDPREVKEVLTEVAAQEDLVLDAPVPRARFRGFGDSALEFELHVWITDPHHRIEIEDRLNTAMYAALDRENIDIPFPQRDVRVSSPPESPDTGVSAGHEAGGTSAPTDRTGTPTSGESDDPTGTDPVDDDGGTEGSLLTKVTSVIGRSDYRNTGENQPLQGLDESVSY